MSGSGSSRSTSREREGLTIVTSIPETLDLLDEAGLPDVGIMVDLWHVWDTPDVERHLPRTSPHHRCPRRRLVRRTAAATARSRARAGSRTAELMRVLHDAGWRGAWDVEIFGDPERADSLWSLDLEDAAQRAYAAIARIVP